MSMHIVHLYILCGYGILRNGTKNYVVGVDDFRNLILAVFGGELRCRSSDAIHAGIFSGLLGPLYGRMFNTVDVNGAGEWAGGLGCGEGGVSRGEWVRGGGGWL